MSRSLVVASTHSSGGKTTVTIGLIKVLRGRSLSIQPFKVGPDFIDPGHLSVASGRISRNLDTWMLSEDAVRETFISASADTDIAIIEGVMGLFDGRSAADTRGSTAHVAKLLGSPVLLIVDASGAAASIAAVVKGFAEFDPEVHVAAVLCNRVAGERHYQQLEAAIRKHTRVEPVGWLPRREDWRIPSRHLGLVTQGDLQAGGGPNLEQLAAEFEKTVDVDLLLRLSEVGGGRAAERRDVRSHAERGNEERRCVRIGVARDAAFCFYYQDSFDLLEAAGAELVSFSPLADRCLPDNLDGIYLGGGYPELHARSLAENRRLIEELRDFHRAGGIIYAECGGLMYCARELVDGDGRVFPMLDLLPARTIMQRRRVALGYVSWRSTEGDSFGPAGTVLRGHEYHYSRLEPLGPLQASALLEREGEKPRPDGFIAGGLLAGYAHLHFGSNPTAARSFVDACRNRATAKEPRMQ